MSIPATREYAYEVTVPAETPVATPHVEETSFQPGEVVQVEITIPDGAAGLAGIALGMQGTQVMPIKPGQYFVGNGEPILRVVEGYPNSGKWQAVAYNTDIHAHTFQVRYSVKEIVERPALPGGGTALPLTSTGEPTVGTTEVEGGETGKPGESEPSEAVGGEPIKVETPVEPAPPAEPPLVEAPAEAPPEPEPLPGEVPIEPETPAGEVPSLGEFTGEEQGGETPDLTEPGGEAGPIEIVGEKHQPVSAAGRHKPAKPAKRKVKKKPVKRRKATVKKHAAKKHAATRKVKKATKRAATKTPAKHAAARRAPAAHRATHAAPAAHRAPPASKPKPKAAAHSKTAPATKAAAKPRATPKAPPPPPKRKPPPPPPKRKGK